MDETMRGRGALAGLLFGAALVVTSPRLAAAQQPAAAKQAPAAAQQPAAPESVTLEQAVRLALEHSPTMVQAEGGIRNADAAQRSAVGAFLPSLSLSAGSSLASSDRYNSATNTVISGASRRSYNAGVSSSVDLYTGGRHTAELNRAKANGDAADANLVAQRFSVTLQAQNAFFDVLRAGELARVAQSQLQTAQEGQAAAEQRLKVGSATRSDVLRSQLAVTQAKQALSQAQSQERAAQFALGRLVGTTAPVAATAPPSLEPKPLAIPPEELAAMVQSQAPVVTAAAADVKAGQAGVKVARAQYLPTLRLSGGYNWLNQQFGFDNLQGSWSVGLGISLPVFNGFQREQQVEQASVQEDVARAQLEDAQRGVRADLEKALAGLSNAEQQIELSQQAVQVAEEDLRVQRERYRLGASTILDQVTSQQNLAEAQKNLVNARYDYQIARAQVEALVGRSL
ncbi:MAG TPA: TolC family protein [Longimicrobiales bacterium]|nr:TolC family protein [Longimicrobiales bacterium]